MGRCFIGKWTESFRKAYYRKYYYMHKKDYRARERKNNLKYRCGITLEDYERMYKKQKGVCLICGKNHGKKLVVDHNHKINKVRGLICQGCNVKLGWVEAHRKKILNYLDKNA